MVWHTQTLFIRADYKLLYEATSDHSTVLDNIKIFRQKYAICFAKSRFFRIFAAQIDLFRQLLTIIMCHGRNSKNQ